MHLQRLNNVNVQNSSYQHPDNSNATLCASCWKVFHKVCDEHNLSFFFAIPFVKYKKKCVFLKKTKHMFKIFLTIHI